jgi:hypothetical protein
LNFFRGAKVEAERLDAAKSSQGRATIMGNFLARMVDREVPIEVDGQAGRATLRSAPGRGGKKLYWFEVMFDDGSMDEHDRPINKGPVRKSKAKELRERTTGPKEDPIDRTPARGMVRAANDEAW